MALKEVRAELTERIRKDISVDILGSDTDDRAIHIAKANAQRAGVQNLVRFELSAMEESAANGVENGLLLANPPYGLRMGTEEEAKAAWKLSGGLRERYSGWSFGFIANREDFPSFFGARPVSSRTVLAGAEKLWFHWYPADGSTRKR